MPTYKLISWGANSHGQLGQGVLSEQCVVPEEVDLSGCDLRPDAIRKIVGGGGHTLILDAQGRIYSCGRNDKGQTGIVGSEQQGNILTFQRLSLNDKTAVDVCCGWDSSAALTKNGDLYLWGSNRYGQLGDDPSFRSWTVSPICTIRSEKIKRVSMGLRHTAAVTNSGDVLVCGANNKDQLGLINTETTEPCKALHSFTAVPGLTDIEDVACGEHHTVATTTLQGDAYTTYFFGDNRHGQAGLDPRICTRICLPHRSIHGDTQFHAPIHIHAGWSHTNILSDGIVYSWGRNSYGQLGREKIEEEKPWRIQCVEKLPKVVQLSVGSEHNVALTENGKIFCWGWNEHGNCGNGNTKNVLLPESLMIPQNSVGVLVGAGAGHSFAVIKDTN